MDFYMPDTGDSNVTGWSGYNTGTAGGSNWVNGGSNVSVANLIPPPPPATITGYQTEAQRWLDLIARTNQAYEWGMMTSKQRDDVIRQQRDKYNYYNDLYNQAVIEKTAYDAGVTQETARVEGLTTGDRPTVETPTLPDSGKPELPENFFPQTTKVNPPFNDWKGKFTGFGLNLNDGKSGWKPLSYDSMIDYPAFTKLNTQQGNQGLLDGASNTASNPWQQQGMPGEAPIYGTDYLASYDKNLPGNKYNDKMPVKDYINSLPDAEGLLSGSATGGFALPNLDSSNYSMPENKVNIPTFDETDTEEAKKYLKDYAESNKNNNFGWQNLA